MEPPPESLMFERDNDRTFYIPVKKSWAVFIVSVLLGAGGLGGGAYYKSTKVEDKVVETNESLDNTDAVAKQAKVVSTRIIRDQAAKEDTDQDQGDKIDAIIADLAIIKAVLARNLPKADARRLKKANRAPVVVPSPTSPLPVAPTQAPTPEVKQP